MVKEKIAFAYASRIVPGVEVSQALLPQIWWTNINPTEVQTIALTMGVVIDKSKYITVKVDLLHESSEQSCIDESKAGNSQFDHFVGYPDGRSEFIGVSTLHIGGVTLDKIGMYTMKVNLLEGDIVLDERETCFFVANLRMNANG